MTVDSELSGRGLAYLPVTFFVYNAMCITRVG